MDLEESVVRCQKLLGGIFDDLPLTTKSLMKPSFRTIHSIVISVLNVTGFPANYFSAEELNESFIIADDKEQKLIFLRKLILLVQTSREGLSSTNELLSNVRASQIVSGREPHKANILLTELGLAAIDESLHRDRVIRTCLLENKSIVAAAATKNGGSSKELQSSTIKHDNGAISVDSNGHGREKINDTVSWPKTSSELKDHVKGCDSTIDRTVEALKGVLSEEKHEMLSEDALQRPSLRFLHDVILSLCKRTGYCYDESGNGTFTTAEFSFSSLVDKPTKQAFFQKIIQEVQSTLGMTLMVRSLKVISGKECDETRKFLQLLVIAAKQGGSNKDWINPLPIHDLLSNDDECIKTTEKENSILPRDSSVVENQVKKLNKEKVVEKNETIVERQLSKPQPTPTLNEKKVDQAVTAASQGMPGRSYVVEETIRAGKLEDVKTAKLFTNKDIMMNKKMFSPTSSKDPSKSHHSKETSQSYKGKNGEIRMKFSLGTSRFAKEKRNGIKPAGSAEVDAYEQLFEKQELPQTIREVIQRVQYLRSFEEDIEDDFAQLATERKFWENEYKMQRSHINDQRKGQLSK